MIKINAVHKYYGSKSQGRDDRLHVLKGVDLSIEQGELSAIMGSSGSGKSTLLNILGILDTSDSGEYFLDNKLINNINQSQAAQFRNQFIGFVFQSFNLLPFKNATDNVALPLYYQKVSRKIRKKKAMELLEMVGLGDRAEHMPNELSGGQKQRVAIARALITNPKVVLADEPTGALDNNTTHEIMALFKEVHASGKTIVIVTHENEIADACERLVVLNDGRVEK